jgi:mono/diheme cytochrome c family protein
MSKIFNKRVSFLALASTLALAFAACDTGNGGNSDDTPVITSQPKDTTVIVGANASFSVLATNASGSGYKWVRNGTDTVLVGTPILNVDSVTMDDSGDTYKVIVISPTGKTKVSNSAVLRVITVPPALGSRQALIDTGMVLVQNCTGCHGSDLRGHAGGVPPLANSDFFMASRHRTVATILKGREDSIFVNGMPYQSTMPSFDFLTDYEIAGIVTYIRAVKNDSTVVSCDANNLDDNGFAICQKTPRSASAIATDSVAVSEVTFVRDSLGMPASTKKAVRRHH